LHRSHAETKAIMVYLRQMRVNQSPGKTVLITKSQHWPCNACMKIIADSGVINIVVCATAPYMPYYLPHLSKDEIEKDEENIAIRKWLYNV